VFALSLSADATIAEILDRIRVAVSTIDADIACRLESQASIADAGMYPSVPSEQWQDRNGAGRYLYMLFRQDGNGGYLGPDGQRKLYIGTKPAAVADARRLATNRSQWEALEHELRYLRVQRNRIESNLRAIVNQLQRGY
jgi:hypothetical protein